MYFIQARTDAKQTKDYFAHLKRDEYHTRGMGEVVGEVSGRAAELLGMPSEINREMYFRLIDGKHPMTGRKLTARTDKDARIAYEFTADVPKAVTLARRLGGDEQIGADAEIALEETMREAEMDMRCRVRKNGQNHDRLTANMLWIKFPHHVTRNVDDGTCDPHDHTHVIAPNKTYDPVEDVWKAGQFGAIKTDALYYQAALHARQAKRLADRGYAIERDGISYRLLGIDRALVDKFSRRTLDIEAEAKKRGITDPKEKAALGRKLRKAKKEDKTLDELTAEWKARCTPEELRSLETASKLGLSGNAVTAKEARDYAIAHVFQNESVVTEKRLWAEALMHGVGSLLPEDVQPEFKQRKDLIYAEKKGIRYVTTREWKDAEDKLVAFVRDGRGTCKKLWKAGVKLDESLDAEQRKAALKLLNSRDRVMAMRGAAGAGKTYTLTAVREVLEKSDAWGGAFAISTQASRKNLREAGFADADTIAKLLSDEKLQQSLTGKAVFIDEGGLAPVKELNKIFELAERHQWRVIIVGDTKQHGPVEGPSALRLIEERSGLRFAELLDNRRQQEKHYRAAVNDTRRGNELTEDGKTTYLERAIETLDAQGCIVELPKEELYTAAARHHLEVAKGKRGKIAAETKLLVTTTHAEGAAVTSEIRAGLRDAGKLKGRDREISTLSDLRWTPAQRGQAVHYEPGLVVQFDQNATGGIRRGDRFTVSAREGNRVSLTAKDSRTLDLPLSKAAHFSVYRAGTMELAVGDLIRPTKNGRTKTVKNGEMHESKINNGDLEKVTGFQKNGDIVCESGLVIPKDFGHLKPGDTITSFSSQSRTVDHLTSVLTQSSMTAANMEQFYVTVSRGRKSARIFTDNKEALFDAVRHTSARMSATDLINGPAPVQEIHPTLLQRMQSQGHRARRAYYAFCERGRELYQQMTHGKEPSHAR